jgi:hypothetical protein
LSFQFQLLERCRFRHFEPAASDTRLDRHNNFSTRDVEAILESKGNRRRSGCRWLSRLRETSWVNS